MQGIFIAVNTVLLKHVLLICIIHCFLNSGLRVALYSEDKKVNLFWNYESEGWIEYN
jgi:hypothetical protein